MDSFGQNLIVARKSSRKTLRALAKEIGVSPSLLSLIEHNKQRPSKELVVRLAKILGANPDEWCGLAGMITPDSERRLADFARSDPMLFRNLVNNLGRN